MTARRCHGFGFDLTGRWAPCLPEELTTRHGETIPGRPDAAAADEGVGQVQTRDVAGTVE